MEARERTKAGRTIEEKRAMTDEEEAQFQSKDTRARYEEVAKVSNLHVTRRRRAELLYPD